MAIKFGAIAFLAPAIVCAAVGSVAPPQSRPAPVGHSPPDSCCSPPLRPMPSPGPRPATRSSRSPTTVSLAATRSQGRVRDGRFADPLTWNTPYDLTFRTTRYYEGQYGSFGFQYLVLAPLALLALLVAPRRQAVVAAVVASSAILLILGTEPNARYLYSALPLLFVPLAALLGWAAAHHRLLARALLAFAVACAAINVYFLPGVQLLP